MLGYDLSRLLFYFFDIAYIEERMTRAGGRLVFLENLVALL
jgi:hypothetical protein